MKKTNIYAEFRIMGDAFDAAFSTVAVAAAARDVQRFVHGKDNVGNRDVAGVSCQNVSPAGATDGFDQIATPEFGKQLFQIGNGNILPFADTGQRYRSALLVPVDIDHGRYGETPFGGQSHKIVTVCLLVEYFSQV